MRLNLGCGPGPILASTYTYYDASRKLLLAKIPIISFFLRKRHKTLQTWDKNIKFKNITKLNLPENSVEYVYSSHLFEHLYYSDCEKILKKIYTMLIPEGKIRLALPDYDKFIFKYVEEFQKNQIQAIEEFEASLLSYPLNKPKPSQRAWQIITGNLHVHRWHPNYASVERMLRDSGFQKIQRYNYHQSQIPEITFLENRQDFTFYIEATK